jgi:hypothetical protein
MKSASTSLNRTTIISTGLRGLSVTKLSILALHWAELIVRMEPEAIRPFIVRFMRDERTRDKYIATIAAAIVEHEWLAESYRTLAGIELTTLVQPAEIVPIKPVSAYTFEPTPSGNDARLAANAAALDNWDEPAA